MHINRCSFGSKDPRPTSKFSMANSNPYASNRLIKSNAATRFTTHPQAKGGYRPITLAAATMEPKIAPIHQVAITPHKNANATGDSEEMIFGCHGGRKYST